MDSRLSHAGFHRDESLRQQTGARVEKLALVGQSSVNGGNSKQDGLRGHALAASTMRLNRHAAVVTRPPFDGISIEGTNG
jgi:hypothetical protein